MIEERIGDIFTFDDLTHIVHQANLFHTFGSGIAAQIRKRFPRAYEADRATPYGDKAKLGTYSTAAENGRVIMNLYSQVGIGGKDRQTSYDAMAVGMARIEEDLRLASWTLTRQGGRACVLGIPHGIGCGLANGSWPVVRAIIATVFEPSSVRAAICSLGIPEAKPLQ